MKVPVFTLLVIKNMRRILVELCNYINNRTIDTYTYKWYKYAVLTTLNMNIITTLKGTLSSLLDFVKGLYRSYPKTTVIMAVILIFILFSSSKDENNDFIIEEIRIPSVEVATITSLSFNTEPVTLLGEVRSVSQAELRAQKSGKVTNVYVTAGQFVGAGSILAEIDNAAERAAVLSAQGALASAQAQLDKTNTGARGEDKASTIAQSQSAITSLFAAQDSARSAYSQAYTLAQDAVYAQADDFFSNAYTVNPSFRVRSADFDEKNAIEKERVEIGRLLETWKENTYTNIPENEISSFLTQAQNDLERIKVFLNRISAFVSEQEIDDTINDATKSTQEVVMLGARSSIDSARASVNGARTALANALSFAQTASLTESKTLTGARDEDVRVAEAFVTQARGALASAYAALENSIIRTPISGTVSTFNVSKGDFVSSMQTLAVVANEGALEIETYVSGGTLQRIVVGDSVLIDGMYDGTVTSVAPGLDPVTKKARVTIGIEEQVELVNGSFVEVLILGSDDVVTEITEYSVPITAIKVLPRGLAVFTLSDENRLTPVPIEEGPIIGSKMILLGDVAPDLKIVTDVRGFREGDKVQVLPIENK